MFLDVNTNCFWLLSDYLNNFRIAPPDSFPKTIHFGEEYATLIQQILLAFGSGKDDISQ